MKFIPVLIGCLLIWLLIAVWLKFYANTALVLHHEHGNLKMELLEACSAAQGERKQINDKLDIILNFVTNNVSRDISVITEH